MRHPATKFVVASWLGLVGTGLGLLLQHGNQAGAIGQVPLNLSAELSTALGWQRQRPLLVLCAHPMCPCLPSTLGELRRVLAPAPNVDVRVVAFVPDTPPPAWEPAALAALHTSLPGATTFEDREGVLASRLGARTSGHVLLFGTGGALQFSGGVTAGRGHVGENAASRSLGKTLTTNSLDSVNTAVFGCPLLADEDGRHDTSCCQPQ